MGGVGVEVLLRQSHARQVLARRAVGQDGVGRRQMIGGDVVAQHRQRTHAAQGALRRQGALPVGRATDVGALRPPVVERAGRPALLHHRREHGRIDLLELLRSHMALDDGVDLLVVGPQVAEGDGPALGVVAQGVVFDVEAYGPGDGIGHHQRRRGEEGLLRLRMDAPVEIAIAREHRGGIEIALDDLALDGRVQGPAHAVAGGAGIAHDAEAQPLQLRQQPGLFQVEPRHLGARRQRGLDPGAAPQPQAVGVARQQPRRHQVAGVGGVGAARDGGDDHRPVRHPVAFCRCLAGDAPLGQGAGGQPAMGIRGSGQVALHRG